METAFKKILQGYQSFREKYVLGDQSIMRQLAHYGQKPEIMVVACCDSRVDPSVILQCEPGDLFTVRNVANIIPPYEPDSGSHGTSAALEFGICYLNIKHLIILGHTQCGGIEVLLKERKLDQNDFISRWVSIIDSDCCKASPSEKNNRFFGPALAHSYHNCLTFPWIKSRVQKKELRIHLWYFDIETGEIYIYSAENETYEKLTTYFPQN